MSPLVAWVSDNSGVLILLTVGAVLLIKGLGLFYSKQNAGEDACATGRVQAVASADAQASGRGDSRCSGARE
jgi:hypothetical protein